MEGESSKTYVFGNEGNGALGTGFVPGMLGGLLSSGIGGFGGFGNWGINGITDLFGLAIIASMFGWNNGGFGGFGGNGAAGAGFLSNQLNNDAGRELIMNAIQGTDADIRALATASSTDFDTVKAGINSVNAAIASVAAQTGMSSLQVINAIQSGNAAIGRQLCECCCENRLLTTQQGYESRIATIEQTNTLGAQADRNTRSIADAIAAQTVAMNDGFCAIKERELQSKIDSLLADNAVLRSTISENRQTERFLGAFNALDTKITELAAKQPNTVPVVWPNLTAVNNTPYGGYYGYGYQGNIWG